MGLTTEGTEDTEEMASFLHHKKGQAAVKRLLKQLDGALQAKDWESACDLVDRNEYGIAFELICTQLYEDEIQINENVYSEINSIAELTGLTSCDNLVRPLVR